MKPSTIIGSVAIIGAAVVGLRYLRSTGGTSALGNAAASPRLPGLPLLPALPSLPGLPALPAGVSGAAPNAPTMRAPRAPDGIFGGLWQ